MPAQGLVPDDELRAKGFEIENDKIVFLNGPDCYALRCAYLHEGSSDIQGQRARTILEKFRFGAPRPGLDHNNRYDRILHLQVDVFCKDISAGVTQWMKDIKGDSIKEKKLTEMLVIYQY